MPFQSSPPSAEQVARVRALYRAGATLVAITAETGFHRRRLYYWIDHDYGPDGKVHRAPLPRRRVGSALYRDVNAKRRLSLANRIWRAAEAQVCEIETRLAQLSTEPAEAERDARALAVLARVVRELAALDVAARKAHALKDDLERDDTKDEDARGPTDLDTFRRELARRLDALRGDGAL